MRVYNPPTWEEIRTACEKEAKLPLRVETGSTHPDDSFVFGVVGLDEQRREALLVSERDDGSFFNWVLGIEDSCPQIYEFDGAPSNLARFQ